MSTDVMNQVQRKVRDAASRDEVRLGIVGAGKMAAWHLRAYRSIPGVRVDAIANPASHRGHELAKKFNIRSHYWSAREMIQTHALDAVDICTPAEYHGHYILAALERGLHVYTEKPMCTSAQEAERIVDANRCANRIIFNGFNYRYWPEMQRICAEVRSGRLGEIRFARMVRVTKDPPDLARRNSSGAELFYEFHSHFVDLLYFFGMPDPVAVFACGTSVHDWPMHPDTGVLLLMFPQGALAEIVTSCATPGLSPAFLLVGTKGSLRLDYGKVSCIPKQDEWSMVRLLQMMAGEAMTIPWRVLRNPFLPSCRHFVRCLRRRVSSDSDERAALRVLRVTDAAVESFRNRTPSAVALGGVAVERMGGV